MASKKAFRVYGDARKQRPAEAVHLYPRNLRAVDFYGGGRHFYRSFSIFISSSAISALLFHLAIVSGSRSLLYIR